MTMIRPLATYWATGGNPKKNMTLIITASSRLPAIAPRNVPMPPRNPTPPSTAAVIEFEDQGRADDRVARARLRRDIDPGEGGKRAGDGIGYDPRSGDVDAASIGAFRVVPRRVDVLAERRRLQETPAEQQQNEQEERCRQLAGEPVREPGRDMAAGPGHDQQRHAADDERGGERHDDGRDTDQRHDRPDHAADRSTHRHRYGDADRRPAIAVADIGGSQHTAEAHRGADGKVDAAHQHDQGLGECHDRDGEPVLGETRNTGDAQEARVEVDVYPEQCCQQHIEADQPAIASPDNLQMQRQTAHAAAPIAPCSTPSEAATMASSLTASRSRSATTRPSRKTATRSHT